MKKLTRSYDVKLYGGSVSLDFNEGSHRYTVDGNHVEGVTTILSRVVAKDGLIQWAVDLCLKERDRLAHRKKKDAGANIGTLTHKWVEQYIQDPETPIPAGAEKPCGAFKEWATIHQPQFLFSERVCYSKQDNYAGTCDAAAVISGKKYLIDWKTAEPRREWLKGRYTGRYTYYPEHFIQIAAYAHAIHEETGDDFDGLMVVYIPKSGEMRSFREPDVASTVDAWLSALRFSRWLKSHA